jgi:hypothetical protein
MTFEAREPLPVRAIEWLPDDVGATRPDEIDPAAVMLTCANCGAQMDERKCKLICRCGYFLSCSDYY